MNGLSRPRLYQQLKMAQECQKKHEDQHQLGATNELIGEDSIMRIEDQS